MYLIGASARSERGTGKAGHFTGYSLLAILLLAGSAAAQDAFDTNAPPFVPPPFSASTNAASPSSLSLDRPGEGIWDHDVGLGFRASTESLTLSAGAVYGVAAFGGVEQHHMALGSLTFGHMLGSVVGQGHWYAGNPEIRVELFGGMQFHPTDEWLVGLTPHFRYSFATGTRWIPFMDIGAGVTATSIREPDLGGTFEFNLQAGLGLQCFLKKNLALSLESRYIHFSSANIYHPNQGVNGVMGLLGISFFF
jgi:opacity protein-like surface antigen